MALGGGKIFLPPLPYLVLGRDQMTVITFLMEYPHFLLDADGILLLVVDAGWPRAK